MSTSEQLEREAEATRAHISATLDELRGRMSPGQVVDQLIDYASDSSGGMFVSNLRQQVVANPLPVTLMGAGLAWLAMSSWRGPPNTSRGLSGSRLSGGAQDIAARAGDGLDRARTAVHDTRDRVSDAASRTQDAARSAMSAASQTYDDLAESASATYDAAADRAGRAYNSAADRASRAGEALKDTASSVGRNFTGAKRSLTDLFHDQPLVLAGLGIALGALIGAALPSSETENELMGDTSDSVKREASEFAREQAEKGKAVAEHAWQSVKSEADEQGLTGNRAAEGSPHATETAAHGREATAQGDASQKRESGSEASLVPSVGDAEHRVAERRGD